MSQNTANDREMVDILRTQIERGVLSFVLSPERWAHCNLPVTLKWKPVHFTEANASKMPVKTAGVYCFVLHPSMTGPPDGSYLLYIGKTKLFRRRYNDYLRDRTSPRARQHIQDMLRKYDTFLWFYYAPIDDVSLLTTVEETLKSSCLPPMNIDFEARVNTAMRAWRTLGSFRP